MSVTELETAYAEDFDDDEDYFEDFDDDESLLEENDELESLFADDFDDDDEDFDDDEAFDDDDETLSERRFRRRGRRFPRFRRGRTRYRSRGRPRFRRTTGRRTARVRTRSGRTTKVRLNQSFATAKDLNAFKVETKKAIANARKETKDNFTKLDTRLNKFTKTLDKKINSVDADHRKTRSRVRKIESSSRMSSLMPLLMGDPEVNTITFTDVPTADKKTVSAKVDYKDNNNMMLPLLLMSGSGGGGGMNDSALIAFALMK